MMNTKRERDIAINVAGAVVALITILYADPLWRFLSQICLGASVGLGVYQFLLWKRNA